MQRRLFFFTAANLYYISYVNQKDLQFKKDYPPKNNSIDTKILQLRKRVKTICNQISSKLKNKNKRLDFIRYLS